MTLKKDEMLGAIESMRENMTCVMGLLKTHLNSMVWFDPKIQSQLTSAEIEEGYKWLKSIFNENFVALRRCYRQRNPEYWTRLIQFGDAHLYPEYTELKKLLGIFRARFSAKDKPFFFRRPAVFKKLGLTRSGKPKSEGSKHE